MQDAAIRAFRYFGSLRDNNDRAWLLTIVRNTWYERAAQRGARPRLVEYDEMTHAPADGRSVAALVYKRRLHVIHVFVWPSRDRVRATDARTVRGFHEQHWTIRDLSVWAVSDVNEDDRKTFASLLVAGS